MTSERPALSLVRRTSLAVASVCLATSQALLAHGGQYRGPGAVTPVVPTSTSSSTGASAPGGTGAGPSTGSSASPGRSPSSGGAAANPGAATGAAPPTTTYAGALDDDLGRWEFWWEFGKDPYLRLRESVHGHRPPEGDDALLAGHALGRHRQRLDDSERVELATALREVLRTAKDRDVLSAAIVAMAKIGRDGLGWSLSASFVPFLASHDQELRETAALALGIAGQPLPEVVQVLLELIADGRDGRRLSGDVPVNERTRAFAAYAIGLLLARRPDLALTHRIVTQLLRIVDQPNAHGRELQVAAIEALALLPNDWSGPAVDSLRQGIALALRRYYEAERGSGDQLLQAHVPVALARLLPPGSDLADAWRKQCHDDLRRSLSGQPVAGHAVRSGPFLTQSLVLALGELGRPWTDPRAADAAIGALLRETYRECRDEQARSFALLSIARLGGAEARQALLEELGRAGKAIEQPWCAMALGVLEARRRTKAATLGPTPEPDADLRAALQAAFDAARNPNARAAFAVALGLTGDPAAATPLRRALPDHRMQDDVAGYLSLSLGMLGDPRALGELRHVFRSAAQRPFLRMQSIRALGLLGDDECVDDLCQQLREGGRSLTQLAATALALGEIGDRRAVAPLLQIVRDPECVALGRAFAVAALGTIADKDPLPWNSPYASHGNYRASTSTLTDGQSGVLDIL